MRSCPRSAAAPLTVAEALARATEELRASGVDTPRLDAELLLGKAIGATRTVLYADRDRALSEPEVTEFRALVERRARREPAAYVLGEWGFRRLNLRVDPRALIPRPETELLVDAAYGHLLELLTARPRPADTPPVKIADVGTGSGAIACTVAAEAPSARVVACDVSADALAVAALNRSRLGLDRRVELVRGDLLAWLAAPADLVLANLPYLPPTRAPELMPEVAGYEPHLALFADGDGLALMRRLLADARRVVRSGGSLLLELDPGQVEGLQSTAPWAGTTVLRDLMGNERVVRVDVP